MSERERDILKTKTKKKEEKRILTKRLPNILSCVVVSVCILSCENLTTDAVI